jgi:hypothetical protein
MPTLPPIPILPKMPTLPDGFIENIDDPIARKQHNAIVGMYRFYLYIEIYFYLIL